MSDSLAVPSTHQTLDPRTGDCLDCGATGRDIDDNLFETCEKVTGPNRIAIVVARRDLLLREREIRRMRQDIRRDAASIAATSHRIREKDAERLELAASIEKLKAET